MRVHPRTKFGNPVLRRRAKLVSRTFLRTAAFRSLIGDMFKTMRVADGIGLAAPQIGKSLQIAVVELAPTSSRPRLKHPERIVIVNPRIMWRSKQMKGDWEGCLSLDGVRGVARRPKEVEVKYLDEGGETITRKVSGLLARVFQHEIDHLNGVLYVDRVKDLKTLISHEEFLKRFRR